VCTQAVGVVGAIPPPRNQSARPQQGHDGAEGRHAYIGPPPGSLGGQKPEVDALRARAREDRLRRTRAESCQVRSRAPRATPQLWKRFDLVVVNGSQVKACGRRTSPASRRYGVVSANAPVITAFFQRPPRGGRLQSCRSKTFDIARRASSAENACRHRRCRRGPGRLPRLERPGGLHGERDRAEGGIVEAIWEGPAKLNRGGVDYRRGAKALIDGFELFAQGQRMQVRHGCPKPVRARRTTSCREQSCRWCSPLCERTRRSSRHRARTFSSIRARAIRAAFPTKNWPRHAP